MRVEVRGQVFETVEDCASHFNIAPSTVTSLLSKGKPDSIGSGSGNWERTDTHRHGKAKEVRIGPLTFKSQREAARQLCVSRKAIAAFVQGDPSDNLLRKAMIRYGK